MADTADVELILLSSQWKNYSAKRFAKQSFRVKSRSGFSVSEAQVYV